MIEATRTMMGHPTPEELGEPDLKIAGFQGARASVPRFDGFLGRRLAPSYRAYGGTILPSRTQSATLIALGRRHLENVRWMYFDALFKLGAIALLGGLLARIYF
jgi:hypothetical protein